MENIKSIFNVEKPIVAMCHLQALPGDPKYDSNKGMNWVIEKGLQDLMSLQNAGVDAVMFSNEFSLPYLTDTEAITAISMARIIGELKKELVVPFGVNVLWDPIASIDLAVATGALFVREIFSGVYASDFGLWNTNIGKSARHLNKYPGADIKLFHNIVPEAASYLGNRTIEDIAKTSVFNNIPDALCVSGATAGSETSTETLKAVKNAVPDTFVFANTGLNIETVQEKLSIADGGIVGTTFKKDGFFYNAVDEQRTKQFMEKVMKLRS